MSELYYPEATSTGHIVTKIAEGLATSFNVHVLCSQPNYSARGQKAAWKEVRHGVHIERCWGSRFDKNSLPLRFINLVTISLSLFLKAVWRFRRGDLVLVVTNPPTLPFTIALASRLRDARCSMIVHDAYPELAVAAGKLRFGSTIERAWVFFNHILYGSLERVFFLGRDMRALAVAKYSEVEGKGIIATNWSDFDEVVPASRQQNALLRDLGLTDKFVIQYAGNMGYPNDVETIISAASLVPNAAGVHFLFIGSGGKKPLVESAVAQQPKGNITLLSHRPRAEQSVFLNACDIAMVSLVADMKGVSVPSRLYNILAAGKPIIAICEPGSEVALVIEEEAIGWVVEPGNAAQLVATIEEARANSELLAEMGARARIAAESKYSFASVLAIFRQGLAG